MKSDWLFSITNICLLLSSCVNVNNFSYADLNYDKSITLVTKKSICSGLESTSFLELANKGNDCEYTNAMCLCKADDNNLFIVFVIAFNKTFLYNNFSALFMICIVVLLFPKLAIPSFLLYFLII